MSMEFRIHDFPHGEHGSHWPMEEVSFHVNDVPIDRLWWDGDVFEIVLVNGEVWRFDFKGWSWNLTETVAMFTHEPALEPDPSDRLEP